MSKTKIEWTETTWNPVRGCSRVSEGCRNCYAGRLAARFCGATETYTLMRPGELSEPEIKQGPFWGFATRKGWTGRVELIESKLEEPLHWRKPRTVFVNSMSDLWHEKLPLRDVAKVYAVMRLAHWHSYQVLTKRPEVRLAAFNSPRFWELVAKAGGDIWDKTHSRDPKEAPEMPTPWIWEGVSVEDQATADERISLLLQTPAEVRFVSAEPLLGPVSFRWAKWQALKEHPYVNNEYDGLRCLDWVIVGGESGPGARPMDLAWVRSIRDQCVAAGVPFFFKGWGEWLPTGQKLPFGAATMTDPPDEHTPGQPMGQDYTYRVGKKAAGRLLDGREWNEMPEVRRG